MADVFVSYVSEDRATAERISRGLERAGFTVWWDGHIHGGVGFRKEIDRQLGAAKVVVVLWSAASLESEWVCDEAQQALDEKKLIPLRLDAVQPPLGFRQAQSLDFSGWNGDPTAGAFADLVDSARHFVARPPTDAPPVIVPTAPRRGRWEGRNFRLIAAAIVLAMAVGVLAVAVRLAQSPSTLTSATDDSRIEIGEFELLTKDEAAAGFAKGLASAIARTFAARTITTVANTPDTGGSTSPTEFILRGTVDRENERFVVGADIQKRRDSRVLWSTLIRQDTDEAGPFQEQVAILVANAMECALTYRWVANDEVSADVFSLFLQFCEAQSDYKVDELDELSRRIVETAPRLAISYAIQAGAAARQIPGKTPDEMEQLRKSAYESARAAQEMNPKNATIDAFADWLFATIDDPARGLAERERLLQRSLQTSPLDFAFYSYGYLLDEVGRRRGALGIFNRAAKTFPLNGAAERASHMADLDHVDVARELFKADARIRPTDSYVISRWFWAEFWYGDPEVAKELVRHPGSVTGNRPRLDTQASGCFNAVLDARSDHRTLSEDQIASACPSGTDHLDGIYAYFGHVDAAYRIALENGVPAAATAFWGTNQSQLGLSASSARGAARGFTAPFDPYMRSVRADPRFMTLVARPELVDYWLETDQWPDFCSTEKLPYDCKEAALAARAAATK